MNEQVVLITGASRGFGGEAARRIAARGNHVVATMRNPERDGPAIVAGHEDRVTAAQLDVTDVEAVERVAAETLARFGRIDVLINNAGYGLYGPIEEVSEAQVWRQFDTNVLGQWRMAKAVLPSMRARGAGKIVNVSSLAGRVAGAWLGMYAAAKHGVEGMSEALRFEVGHTGVQVCVLEPGMYVSDWQTGSLDVAAPQLEGRSAYQETVEAALANFRARAKTRPASGSVGVAMADMVELEQPLPMRWPVGEDSTHLIESRLNATEAEWEALRRAGTLRTWRRPGEQGGVERQWGGENVVLITGASRGFGAAAARECAARGSLVAATMRDPDRDGEAVREGFEDGVVTFPLDVTDAASIEAAVEAVRERFGRIDVLVNNAGYGLYGPLEDLGEDECRRQLDANLLGPWRLQQAVLPVMREQGWGKVVNVSSLSGQVPRALRGMYAASKHAVEAMSEALADEVAPFGVQVTILQPGQYRSDWQTRGLDVCETVRAGRSAYQPGVERKLAEFQGVAATRPGSDAVGMAIADAVQLQQRLPVRWPLGEDALRLIPARRATPDDVWERDRRAEGWGLTMDDMA
ncbi:MAG: SDR family oxidoreductase [Chloroflexi bacterium]|nr:SDR family oxidoreductase [Chloroflexota bacterium]